MSESDPEPLFATDRYRARQCASEAVIGLRRTGKAVALVQRANHWLIDRDRHPQVSRWNRRCILTRAFVLAFEQFFQLSL
jgi:hypothetical protein